MTATTEFVVPRSMPTTLPMRWFSPSAAPIWLDSLTLSLTRQP
ncbi:MAG: hypothetical protein SWJ54_07400 [Cyanobacteriota bacterium]|nr:hypothetical protein [Cyanobacteriota bacterium]